MKKTETKKKSWFRRHWILSGILSFFLLFFVIGIFQGVGDSAENTKNSLFSLTGNEIIEGVELCDEKRSFSTDVTLKRFGIELPKECSSISSFDLTNYCSLGSKEGEKVDKYYCYPIRYIECNTISTSGEIKKVKRYGIKKELELVNETPISDTCTNATFRLSNIIIE